MATSIRAYQPDSNPAAPTSFDATPISMTGLTWMSSLRDLPREHGFESLRLEGSLPAGLSGTLYRTGPSLFSIFGKPDGHLFDGDGAVTAVRFENGRPLGAAKLVQSMVVESFSAHPHWVPSRRAIYN
jgi:carotenoid cleavage dioxygenase-like enzyme